MYTTLQWQLVLVATSFVRHRLTLQLATGDGVFLRNWQLQSGPNWLQSGPVAGFSIWLQLDFKTLILTHLWCLVSHPSTQHPLLLLYRLPGDQLLIKVHDFILLC